jgi:hypothetical protein
MFTRSLLTTIIGFLIGCILYLSIEPHTTFIFLFGGLGYLIGMILDNTDRKKQLETFHFSSIPSTHEIFHSDEIPEAVFIYSTHDNTTSVLLDYKIEAKPENYRLSVLKNLQEFDFRIIEDTSQTFFSLCIQYPEFNYPAIKEIPHQKIEFFYDIKERSDDFQGAIQKLIPGIIISIIQNPDIFGNKSNNYDNTTSFPPKSFFPSIPSNYSEDNLLKKGKKSKIISTLEETDGAIDPALPNHETSSEQVIENQTVNNNTIDEGHIRKDLNQPLPLNKMLKEVPPDSHLDGEDENLKQTHSENDVPENSTSSDTPHFLTAKQIEEAQDRILTHEKTDKPQSESEILSVESETDEEVPQGIFNYSSVDTSASMPMDAAGKGIFETISRAIEERIVQKSRNNEKIPTEEG